MPVGRYALNTKTKLSPKTKNPTRTLAGAGFFVPAAAGRDPRHMSSPLAHGRRLMLLSAACFVANVLLIRALGSAAGDAWTTTAFRFAAGLLVCVIGYRSELRVRALLVHPRLVLRGLVGGAATFGLYHAIVHLGAGRAIFLSNTYVVIAALLAVPMLAEPLRVAPVAGAVAALVGLALLTGAAFGELRAGPYDALVLAVAVASAWIVVAIRQLAREGLPPATIFASQCLYGLLLCAPFAAASAATLSPGLVVGMVAAGLLAAAGQLAMTAAFRVLPVADGAIIQTLVPLGVAAGGVAFFGEHLGGADLVGGGLIVAGSLLPALRERRPA